MTFDTDFWVLRSDEIDLLRCQCFPPRSPNYISVFTLGWISIDRFIKVKTLFFLKSMMVMTDEYMCKQLLVHRAGEYQNYPIIRARKEHDSHIFEILNAF